MNSDNTLLTPEERAELQDTALVLRRLEPQFRNLGEQHEAGLLGMWVFLVTEVLFFGTLFTGLAIYRLEYGEAFEKASVKLNWVIGGINTVVLLVSSLFMALAVQAAKRGQRQALMRWLGLTALLGAAFLGLKAFEYYTDYRDYLIPGWRFNDQEWVSREGLRPEQVGQVKLFLLFYWFMTALHGLHVLIGVGVLLVVLELARRGTFRPDQYTVVEATGLYWHFVDTVWIFLLPMLYLLGTHTFADIHLF